MKCPEERKVKLATFLLQESVKEWWTLYATSTGGADFVTWEGLQKGFKEKYYPRSFINMKRKEFLSLK